MSLEAFEAAGLYDPASPRAAERAELLEHLAERFGVDPVIEAAGRVPLFTVAVELTDPAAPRMSAREISEATGLPAEEVLLMRTASGFPVADVDERTLPSTTVEDAAVMRLASELFGRDATLAFTRVLGAAAQQISEAARAVFATAVVEGTGEAAGATELELSQSNEVAWTAYRALPAVIEHVMLERADTRQDIIGRIVEGSLAGAVVFVDLVGSTAWTNGLEPGRHSAALARFEQAAWDAAVRAGGRMVKLIGDEAMLVVDDADTACRMAVELCAVVAADPDLPAARGGVGVGMLTARGGDYFGPVVNLAARVLDEAAPGQVVVSETAAAQLDERRWAVDDLGPTALRGISEPVRIYGVRARTST